jgi:hypothetical protein
MSKVKWRLAATMACVIATFGDAMADDAPSTETPKAPSVEGVEFTAGDSDTFVAKIAGPSGMQMNALLAFAYCRTHKERTARGYDGWLPKAVQREYAMKATVQTVTVNGLMYKGERPDGKPPSTKDWCAEVEAKPEAEAPKP